MKKIVYHHSILMCFCFGLFQFGTLAHTEESVETSDKITTIQADHEPVQPTMGMLPNSLLSLNTNTEAFSKYAFLVDKSARTLTVWENQGNRVKLVVALPTDIGRLKGDKTTEGDYRTPEGIYFFQNSMDGRKVDYSQYGDHIYTLDYPNYFDKLDRKTGRGIWLHAVPDTTSLSRGSRGCVVVRNKVISELDKYIELKRTPIVIVDKVTYLPEEEWLKQQAEIKSWLEKWRTSWTGKVLDDYLSLYSDRFKSNGMNKERWGQYKKGLAQNYQYIDVALEDVQIFNQGHKIVLRFLQKYKSDKNEDFGSKVLYVLKGENKYEIVGENWRGRTP